MCEPSLRKVGKGVLKLLIGNGLVHLTRVTLTFDPQINRIHLLPRMDGPSLKKVGQGVLELLIGTDLQTDRPQSNMPSLLLLHFKGMLGTLFCFTEYTQIHLYNVVHFSV